MEELSGTFFAVSGTFFVYTSSRARTAVSTESNTSGLYCIRTTDSDLSSPFPAIRVKAVSSHRGTGTLDQNAESILRFFCFFYSFYF